MKNTAVHYGDYLQLGKILTNSFCLFFSPLSQGTYGKLHSVRTRRVAGHLDISARGMLAVGDGTFVDVFGSGVLSAPPST